MEKDEQLPRRIRMDLWTPAELAIHNAVQEIEKMPADVRLTGAVTLLSKARDLVADFIDNPTQQPTEQEKTLAQLLIAARESAGLTLKQVQDMDVIPGDYLAQLEQDDKIKQPSTHALWKLSQLYNIDIKPLLIAGGVLIKKEQPSEPSIPTGK